MALINIGMTKDEALRAVEPNAAGKYRAQFTGLQADDKGNVIRETQKGSRMVVAKFKPLPPATNPSNIFFNAVIGTFSFAALVEALPEMFQGTGLDEDAGKGHEVWLDLTVEPSKDKEGNVVEGQFRNNIKKLSNINAA